VLRLYDTAAGSVRPLELREPGRVSMYVCGLTVYDHPHIGHGRQGLVFDVLRRYLVFSGYEVHFVSNVTDIDDRIIQRALDEGRSEPEVAAEFEASWWDAASALGILRPDDTPHATAYIAEMVALIEDLVKRGVAYETSNGVYLEVARVEGYGLLAHQPLESLLAGARVEVDEEKRSPLDFALWKKARPGEPTWPSPFGAGRPGWHTECVVMSLDLLGEGFDLHGGGVDLIFPHHENERAQAVAEGKAFARHWMHNGWVMVGKEKMSKSLGNFTTVAEMAASVDPRAYRLLVLRSQYRSQIEVTPDTLLDAEKGLDRLDTLARRFALPARDHLAVAPVGPAAVGALVESEVARFCEHMDDDLDTPGALAGLFDGASRAHALADRGDEAQARPLAETVSILAAVLGLALGQGTVEIDAETRQAMRERDEARKAGDFDTADGIRDRLVTRGWIVEDGPEGTTLRR
jgi:cysteinyl-tRNA synthetase